MDTKASLRQVGEDVVIHPLVSITRPSLVKLGSHVAIDPYFHCTTQLAVGDYVHISSHVSVIGGAQGVLRMGNFTNLSAHGCVVCGSDDFGGAGIVSAPGLPERYRDHLTVEPVILEDFANTGVRVTLLPGVTVPQGTVIGACSLVRKKDQLEPWTIYAGNPLRRLGTRPREKMLQNARALGYG